MLSKLSKVGLKSGEDSDCLLPSNWWTFKLTKHWGPKQQNLWLHYTPSLICNGILSCQSVYEGKRRKKKNHRKSDTFSYLKLISFFLFSRQRRIMEAGERIRELKCHLKFLREDKGWREKWKAIWVSHNPKSICVPISKHKQKYFILIL